MMSAADNFGCLNATWTGVSDAQEEPGKQLIRKIQSISSRFHVFGDVFFISRSLTASFKGDTCIQASVRVGG
jgi:hypothetical protein